MKQDLPSLQHLYIFLFLIVGPVVLSAQNYEYLRNNGFEQMDDSMTYFPPNELKTSPFFFTSMSFVDYWSAYPNGCWRGGHVWKPELVDKRYLEIFPGDDFDFAFPPAKKGSAYAEIFLNEKKPTAWSGAATHCLKRGQTKYPAIVYQELTRPLQAGERYIISGMFSFRDVDPQDCGVSVRVQHVPIAFPDMNDDEVPEGAAEFGSTLPWPGQINPKYGTEMMVPAKKSNIYPKWSNWTDTFTAKGGEQWLYIGNFRECPVSDSIRSFYSRAHIDELYLKPLHPENIPPELYVDFKQSSDEFLVPDMQWMDLIRSSIDTTIEHISVKAYVWEYPDFLNQMKVANNRLNKIKKLLSQNFPDTKVRAQSVRFESHPGQDPNQHRIQVLPIKEDLTN